MDTPDMTKLLRYVGLCRRAGGTLRGAELIEKALGKANRPLCVLLASDASERTVRQMCAKCTAAGVPCIPLPADKYTLGHTVGAQSPCAALAILPGKGPADQVLRMLTADSQDKKA